MKNKTRFVPMLFSTDMVKEILNGTKTETRRIISVETNLDFMGFEVGNENKKNQEIAFGLKQKCEIKRLIKQKLFVNNIIWVRETFQELIIKGQKKYLYKANPDHQSMKWKSSLFMPKDACRIFLKCTSVHIERLHDITEQGAINEGVLFDVKLPIADFKTKTLYRDYRKETSGCADARSSFMTLWQKINGKESWNENPFVWVYKFECVERPNDFC
jgi:hypothetical protein